MSVFVTCRTALRYLHCDCGIAHRDVKLENIVVCSASDEQPVAKLCDFGLAATHRAGCCMHTRCGSEEYAPPEIMHGGGYDGRKSDVWSFGVVLYATLFGVFPFDLRVQRGAKHTLRFPADASDAARSLLSGMCRDAPHERLTIDDVLQHVFWHPQ